MASEINRPASAGDFLGGLVLEEGDRSVFRLVSELSGEEGGEPGAKVLEVVRRREPLPLDERPHEETPPRAHVFHDALGFAAYIVKEGSGRTIVLADQVGRRMAAVLDEGRPDGVEVVQMHPQTHPRWAPWAKFCGQTVLLEGLVDFLRDHRATIACAGIGEGEEMSSRQLMFVLSQIRCSVSIEVMKGKGATAVNGLMVKTQVRGGPEESEPVELPEWIKVRTPVYVGGPQIEIQLDLVVEASRDGKEIAARLSASDAREAEIAGFELEVGRVTEGLSAAKGAQVALGSIAHSKWARVGRAAV